MMFNNSTLNLTQPIILYPYYVRITWTVVACLQFFMAMIGNFLTVWIVYRDNRLKTTTNYLIADMAVSDLIAALFVFPEKVVAVNFENQWLIGGVIGNALCKLTFFIIDTSTAVSVYSCVTIAIDRYFAVVHPFKRPFEGRIQHVITVIWITAVVTSSPMLYFMATLESSKLVSCELFHWPSYVIYVYVVGVAWTSILPALLTAITYTFTICNLYRRVVPGLQNQERRRREQQNKKILKHCVTIAFLINFCHGFWAIFVFLYLQGKLAHLSPSQLRILIDTSTSLFYFSLVYNFFVYLIFNDIYRENIKALIHNCCRRSDANRSQEIPVGREIIEMDVMNLRQRRFKTKNKYRLEEK